MALNNRSENRSGETFCAVVNHEELPYVARFTYKWTVALREKSLLRVKTGSGVALREGRLASNFIMHAVHKIRGAQQVHYSSCWQKEASQLPDMHLLWPATVGQYDKHTGQKRLFYFWVAVACRSCCCFKTWSLIIWLYVICQTEIHFLVLHLNDHLMCERFLFQKSILFPENPTECPVDKSAMSANIRKCNFYVFYLPSQAAVQWPHAIYYSKKLPYFQKTTSALYFIATCSAGIKANKVKDGICHFIDNFDAYLTNQHCFSEYGKYGSFQVYKKKKQKKVQIVVIFWQLRASGFLRGTAIAPLYIIFNWKILPLGRRSSCIFP